MALYRDRIRQGQDAKQRVLDRLENRSQPEQSLYRDRIRQTQPQAAPQEMQGPPERETVSPQTVASLGLDLTSRNNRMLNTANNMIKTNQERQAAEKAANAAQKQADIDRDNALPGRNVPVLGPVLKGIDALGRATKPASDIAMQLYTPGGAPSVVANATRGAAQGLTRLIPSLGNSAAGRIGTTAAAEAAVGAPLGISNQLARDPQSTPRQLGEAAAFGAGGGALLGGAGKTIGEAAATGRRAGSEFLGNATGAFNAAANRPQYAGKLRLDSKDQNVSRIMDEIRPGVLEAMTPPMESERALRQWIKPFLGNPSNKELAKLTYDDLIELADDARSGMNMYDTAVQVAERRGFDLAKAFDQAPSIKARVPQDASRRAYGFPQKDLPRQAFQAIDSTKVDPVPQNPAKLSWFERMFGNEPVGITPFGSRGNNIVTTEDQIVNSPIRNTVEGAVENTKQLGRTAYQNTTDMLAPLKNINQQTLDAAMDASRANNLSNTIIRDKFVDLEGNVIGGSLNDLMKKTRGLGKSLDDYLVARHAITRMNRGERVYADSLQMTPQKIQDRANVLEQRYPILKQLGQEWDQFNERLLDNFGVKEGLITQAARDAMRTENPHYASMRRQFTLAEKAAGPKWGTGQSFSGQSAPIKKVSPTGSTRQIVTPIRSAIEQTQAWTNAALRNRSMQEIVKAIQRDPEAMKGVAEIVKKPSTSYKSLDDALREGGSEEFLDLLDNDFRTLFKRTQSGEENIVRAMVNGNPVFVKVHNPEVVKALVGLGNEQAGIILGAMQKLSNATKRGATGLFAPMFAIKSLGADTVQAAIQSPNAFKHLAVDLPYAFISTLADIAHIPGLRNLAQDFQRSGGEYSSLLRGERQLKTSVRDLRRYPVLSPQGVAKGTIQAVKAPFKSLERVADASENMNRMAAFSRAMKGKERTPENVRNALNAARESTVNFSRRGAWAREMESFIPYQNAAIQGINRLARNFKDPKTAFKVLAGTGTLVVLPKLIEYARFKDDPDYQMIPARERYRNIIYDKNPDGTFKKQFMPPEYAALGALITDVLSDVIDNDPQAYKGDLDALANAYTPPIVGGALQGLTQGQEAGKDPWEKSLWGAANATVAAPFAAVGANQSFTGAPIVPQRLEDLSPRNQFDERTSSVGKLIGEKMGLAPMKVDYLLRAYGGDPARLLLPLTSAAGAGTPKTVLFRNFIVDPVFTNTLSSDFYAAKQGYNRAKADIKVGDPVPSWYTEDLDNLVNSTSKNSASKRISALNELKRTVAGDRSLGSVEKTNQLRDIQAQINDIYTEVNSVLMEAGFPFPNR